MRATTLLWALLAAITYANGQTIKIADQSYSVERAVNLQTVTWRWPVTSPIYCLSDTTVSSLRFSCPDCNATNSQSEAQFIGDLLKAEDQSSTAGFPVIRIQNIRVDQYLIGKTLRCEGQTSGQRQVNNPPPQPVNIQMQPAAGRQNGRFSSTGFDQAVGDANVVRTDAKINILFLTNPIILNSNGQRPVFDKNEGNRFFVRDSETQQLRCVSDGNPQPNKYVWTQNGAEFAQGQTTSVSSSVHMGASILCKAFSTEFLDGMQSDAVSIAMSMTPRLNRTNFSQQQKPSGLDGNGRINVGGTVVLECSWFAAPSPTVRYVQMTAANQYVNVSCNEGENTVINSQQILVPISANLQLPATIVQSRCSITVTNYSAAGQYVCEGCINVADGPADCYPKANQVGSNYVTFDVTGPPMVADIQPPPINRSSSEVWIPAWYCADPQPTEVYWQIGDNKVSAGKSVGSYQALQPKPNGSSTDCFEETLVVNPVRSGDSSTNFELNVITPLGRIKRTFKLVVDTPPVEKSGVNVGLAVGLTIGLIVLAVIVGLCVCWFFGLLCCANFGRNKPATKIYRTNVPPGINDVKPAPVPTSRPEPLPRQSPPRNPPVTRIPAPNGHNDSFGNSSVHSEITDSSSYIPYKGDTQRLQPSKHVRSNFTPSSQESGSEAFEPNEYANLIAQTYSNRFATRSPTSV